MLSLSGFLSYKCTCIFSSNSSCYLLFQSQFSVYAILSLWFWLFVFVCSGSGLEKINPYWVWWVCSAPGLIGVHLGGLCTYRPFMLPVARPNVLGNHISVDILKNLKLQPSCDNLVLSLFSRNVAEDKKGSERTAAKEVVLVLFKSVFPHSLCSVCAAHVASLEAAVTICVKWWSLKELVE